MRGVAREIGISHSLLNHYFRTKLDLWKACVDRCFGTMNREVGEILARSEHVGDATDNLRRMIVQYVRLSERFPENTLLLLREAWLGGERFDYIVDRHFKAFLGAARQYYGAVQAADRIRPVPWQTLFTVIFLGGPGLFTLNHLVETVSEGEAPPEAARHAEAVADLVLNGLLKG